MTGKRFITIVLGICAAVTICGRSGAVETAAFVEADEKAFQKGEMDGTVWTSLGALRLARDVTAIVDEKAGIGYISALAQAADGTIYAAAGAKGEIYKVKGGKAEVLAALPEKNLFSLTVAPNGTLYVGSGGQAGKIFRVSPTDGTGKGDVKPFFEPEKVQYIWALECDEKGNIYAATGRNGQVFKVSPQGKGEVLFTSSEKHILSLLRDSKGNLYAGTDGKALVYRYGTDGKLFVLYDADEAEITALAIDGAGNLFVGASTATGGRAPRISIPMPAPPAAGPAPKEPRVEGEFFDEEENAENPPAPPAGKGEAEEEQEAAGGLADVPRPSPVQSVVGSIQMLMRSVGGPPSLPGGPGDRGAEMPFTKSRRRAS